MKKAKIILRPIFIILLTFLIFQFARTRILYNQTRMVPIEYSKSDLPFYLQEILSKDDSITNSYCLVENDTLIKLLSAEFEGIHWIINNHSISDFESFSFDQNEKIGEIQDGTYKNYDFIEPPIRISYNLKRGIRLEDDFIISIMEQNDYVSESLKNHSIPFIYKINCKGIIEFRNIDGTLVYRVNLFKDTDVLFSANSNSIVISFLQY